MSAYQFKWTPILTYARRHLELLGWLEEHTEPVSFSDTTMQRFGVALVAKDLRITVDRSGMRVESGLSGVPTEQLLPAIDGIFSVLEPHDAVLVDASVAASHSLATTDYHEECARFAARVSAVGPSAEVYRPIDASVLVDVESTDIRVQVEWGIVKKSELLDRLTRSTRGRLRPKPGPSEDDARDIALGTIVNEMPSVSLFTDMNLTRRHGGEVGNVDDVEKVIGITNAQAQTLTEGLVQHYLITQEGSA